jgi:hypothetical protein
MQVTALAGSRPLSISPQLKDLVGKRMAATRSVREEVSTPDVAQLSISDNTVHHVTSSEWPHISVP